MYGHPCRVSSLTCRGRQNGRLVFRSGAEKRLASSPARPSVAVGLSPLRLRSCRSRFHPPSQQVFSQGTRYHQVARDRRTHHPQRKHQTRKGIVDLVVAGPDSSLRRHAGNLLQQCYRPSTQNTRLARDSESARASFVPQAQRSFPPRRKSGRYAIAQQSGVRGKKRNLEPGT